MPNLGINPSPEGFNPSYIPKYSQDLNSIEGANKKPTIQFEKYK